MWMEWSERKNLASATHKHTHTFKEELTKLWGKTWTKTRNSEKVEVDEFLEKQKRENETKIWWFFIIFYLMMKWKNLWLSNIIWCHRRNKKKLALRVGWAFSCNKKRVERRWWRCRSVERGGWSWIAMQLQFVFELKSLIFCRLWVNFVNHKTEFDLNFNLNDEPVCNCSFNFSAPRLNNQSISLVSILILALKDGRVLIRLFI